MEERRIELDCWRAGKFLSCFVAECTACQFSTIQRTSSSVLSMVDLLQLWRRYLEFQACHFSTIQRTLSSVLSVVDVPVSVGCSLLLTRTAH